MLVALGHDSVSSTASKPFQSLGYFYGHKCHMDPNQGHCIFFLMDENSRTQSLAAAAALLVVPFMLHGPSENKMIVAQCV